MYTVELKVENAHVTSLMFLVPHSRDVSYPVCADLAQKNIESKHGHINCKCFRCGDKTTIQVELIDLVRAIVLAEENSE